MPTVGEFEGIRVMMFHRDHLPPDFHVEYGGDEAEIAIATFEVLAGQLPTAILRKVREWAATRQAALALDWVKCQKSPSTGQAVRAAMAAMGRNVIVEAEPDFATRSVRLVWADGSITMAQFGSLSGRGVFAPPEDAAFFGKVSVGPRGRSLTWPGELDFCADALWFEAHPQDNPSAHQNSAAE
jgi:hypothetical protein